MSDDPLSTLLLRQEAATSYRSACETLFRFDRSLRRAPLSGFREWLIDRTGLSATSDIRSLVLNSVLPDANLDSLTADENRIATDALISLASEYLAWDSTSARVSPEVVQHYIATSGRGNCLCCGHMTLTESAPGSDQICQVCFWQDDRTDALVFESPSVLTANHF